MRKKVTTSTIEPTNAGYSISFLVCAASSSSHFSVSVRLFSTAGSFPVCSPERTRLTNTLRNTRARELLEVEAEVDQVLARNPAAEETHAGAGGRAGDEVELHAQQALLE